MIITEKITYYLVYSPDEDGYYWQKGDQTSQLFKTKEEAIEAEKEGKLEFKN
ncbi:MAG: hypothetical protein ACTSR2_00850 [Candidatus Hodarchaeales archaeon]